jgi:hypothetical protein
MTRPEVEIAIAGAAAEGWNPGLHDAEPFFAADPTGFWIGLAGDEPVATISAVKYGKSFAFLGFYIVKPGWRGRGLGLRIWNAAHEDLEGRTVGLDSVVAEQHNYQRLGYEPLYGNRRYEGRGGGPFPADEAIVPLSGLAFGELSAYDRPFFPDDRTTFLKSWISQPGTTALGLLAGGRLAGYGVLRPCQRGYKIGPLFADTPAFAERLFAALRASAPAGAPLFLDPPAANGAAVDLAERHGMAVVFETVRMYRGRVPSLPLDRLFGVTSFELG